MSLDKKKFQWQKEKTPLDVRQYLANVPTASLVEELETREAVSAIYAELYQDVKYSVNGPATVLIVTD
ncbi:MAG: BC1881 family protein [Lachnospiraceae bacterium]|nr:BC1881 family protein [Lachnospiraceae bacterium]